MKVLKKEQGHWDPKIEGKMRKRTTSCHESQCLPMLFCEGKIYRVMHGLLTLNKPSDRYDNTNISEGELFLFLGYRDEEEAFTAMDIELLWKNSVYTFGGSLCNMNFKEATKDG